MTSFDIIAVYDDGTRVTLTLSTPLKDAQVKKDKEYPVRYVIPSSIIEFSSVYSWLRLRVKGSKKVPYGEVITYGD